MRFTAGELCYTGAMKKTFPLKEAGHNDARVLESVKNEVRIYLKRERRKPYPEGFNRWEFACRVGAEEAVAVVTAVDDVVPAIEVVAKTGAERVYVEILASATLRVPTAQVGDDASREV